MTGKTDSHPSKNPQDSFCVVIPTRNEAENISPILEEVKRYASDILVVDGHSEDDTLAVVERAGVRHVLDNRIGKGDALRVGAAHTDKEIIVFMDADGSHEVSDIPALVEPIREGRADLVVGSRILGGSDELHGTFNKFIRNTGTNFLAVLVNLKWKTEISDIENGFRAIRREVFHYINLTARGFTIEQEMVLRCLKHKFRVLEVASHEYARKAGYSKLHTLQGFNFLLHFFKEFLF
jgi:dolichol-phosphate mannosyltransferase